MIPATLRRFEPLSEQELQRGENFSTNIQVSDGGEVRFHDNRVSPNGQRRAFSIFDGHHQRHMGDRQQIHTSVKVTGGAMDTTLRGHASPITGLAFGMDGGCVVTCCQGGKVIVHDLPHGNHLAEHSVEPPLYGVAPALSAADGVLAVRLRSPRGRSRGRQTVLIWHPLTAEPVTFKVKKGTPRCLALSPDGGCLALGHDTGQLELWSVAGLLGLPTPRIRVKLARYDGAIQALAFSRGGLCLAMLTTERKLITWTGGDDVQ